MCACLLQPLRRTRVGKTYQAAPGGPFCRAPAGACNVTATSVFSATYAYQNPDTSAPRDYRTLASPFLRPSALLAPLRCLAQLSLLHTVASPEPAPARTFAPPLPILPISSSRRCSLNPVPPVTYESPPRPNSNLPRKVLAQNLPPPTCPLPPKNGCRNPATSAPSDYRSFANPFLRPQKTGPKLHLENMLASGIIPPHLNKVSFATK